MTARPTAARVRRLVCLLAPVAFAAIVWRSLLRNWFHGDDFLHLYQIVDLPLGQWLLLPFGGHVYTVRNAIFSLCWLAFGTDARGWFAVVLLTHLANVALLFRLLRSAEVGPRLAALAAAVWGVARVQEGALGWYSVYGQVVVVTLGLTVLTRVVRHARSGTPVRTAEAAAWAAVLLVGCTAFGVGLGIALAFPLAALVVLSRPGLGRGATLVLAGLPPAVVLLWLGAHALYGTLYEPAVGGAPSLVLTFLSAWWAAPVMLVHLVGVAVTALLDPFGYELLTYPGPRAALLVGVGATVTVAGMLAGPPQARRCVIACLLLAVGGYAMIAVGRAGIWNVPGIPVFGAGEPRYHYAGTAFVAAALARALAGLLARVRPPAAAADALLAACFAGLAALYVRSGWTIDHHDANRRATNQVLFAAGLAATRTPPGQPALVPNRGFGPFLLPPPAFAGWASVFAVFGPEALVGRVRFVDPNEATHRMARPGSRLERVLAPRAPS